MTAATIFVSGANGQFAKAVIGHVLAAGRLRWGGPGPGTKSPREILEGIRASRG